MNLLLHLCCGPCALYPLRVLREAGHQVTGFFYNHNIHPFQEYGRRLDAARLMAEQMQMTLLVRDDYDLEGFLANVASAPAERCGYCYGSRLRVSAQVAAEHGFQAFTSSLLYSRYQKHDNIRTAGEQAGLEHGVSFLYQDFRPGWQEGIKLSKEQGLYRQQYCGCVYSEKERYLPRKERK
jgi:predicted adenine nucleotide alpha hydrolase (AANH) superfamily ATPase